MTYAGEWVDDRRSGHGYYLYANGDEYVGEWQNHLRHGQGKYMYASSGLQYEGQWRDGKRTGEGEITRVEGQLAFVASTTAVKLLWRSGAGLDLSGGCGEVRPLQDKSSTAPE